MWRLSRFIVYFLLLFSLANQVFAFQCPYTILVSESVSPQAGWSAVKISVSKTLRGWTIYEGHLGDNQFALAPEEKTNNHKILQRWDFKPPRNYWIQCHYFETAISMSQMIPKQIKQCKSLLELDDKHNTTMSSNVECK